MLTAREWASLILIGLAVVGLLVWPKTRAAVVKGIPGILRSMHWKVIATFLVMFAWIAVALWVGWLVGLWDWFLLKDSIIITLTLAIPMLFRIPRARTGGVIVKRLALEAAGFAAILTFYLNVEPFPLWAELLIQAVSTFLVMLSVLAATKDEWSAARKLTRGLLGIIGLGAIAWTTVAVIRDWAVLDWPDLLRSFLLTIWLPALLLPLYYLEAFLMTVEMLMVRLPFVTEDREPPRRRVRLAITLGLHLRVKLAARFDGRYNRVALLKGFRETSLFMREFRVEVRRDDAAERERIAALRTNTGRTGTDAEGAQLDRRQFHATKDRLEWISVCEMGRYEGNGRRYWSDGDGLTDIIVDAARHNLPERHGITVQTTPDGQRWRAWRALPSGWVLGMGASGWRSEWVYAGSQAPSSWPGDDDPRWINKMTEPDLPPDWVKDDAPVIRAVEGL